MLFLALNAPHKAEQETQMNRLAEQLRLSDVEFTALVGLALCSPGSKTSLTLSNTHLSLCQVSPLTRSSLQQSRQSYERSSSATCTYTIG